MAQTYKIIRENNNVQTILTTLNDQEENIKDLFCAIRFANGDLMIFDGNTPFETLCTISKKLDLLIDCMQQESLEDYEEDTETEDETDK